MAINSLETPQQESIDSDLKDPALIEIRDLVYRISGIFHQDNKFYLLATRIRRRMKEVRSNTLSDYFEVLTLRPNRDAEMRSLLNEITIGETYFFRSQGQLNAVSKIILPALLTMPSKQNVKKLRIWSAGCSTGEEPYTLSILTMEHVLAAHEDWTYEIVATDLNEHSIAKCKEGLYNEYAMRNLNAPMRDKYFRQEAVFIASRTKSGRPFASSG